MRRSDGMPIGHSGDSGKCFISLDVELVFNFLSTRLRMII